MHAPSHEIQNGVQINRFKKKLLGIILFNAAA
jgi:hypothetical protein